MTKCPAIRAVFVDLDGTLLQGVNTITPRTVAAFEKIRAKGIVPVVATGRLAYEADFAVRAINADRYMIAMNGLAVYDDYRTGHLLYEAYFPEKAAEEILQLLLRENVFFEAYAKNRAWCQTDRAGLIQSCGMDEEHIRFFGDRMELADCLLECLQQKKLRVNKFFVSEANSDRAIQLRDALRQIRGIYAFLASPSFIEIVPDGADKQSAVRMVREAMSLTAEQIMVIGDSENDMGMFDEAAICVAMGNACPELKAKANYVAPTNRQEGVAWALETLLLGKKGSHFNGSIEFLSAEEIKLSLQHSTRQYLAGDLKLPQSLSFLMDKKVEAGISRYDCYHWEKPHYHTTTDEYCYMLSGETRYVDLAEGKEYSFKAGDFYILRHNTPYIQKCLKGCALLFMKAPGINDKVTLPMNEILTEWCSAWENVWSYNKNVYLRQ
jgi:hypothetical protein